MAQSYIGVCGHARKITAIYIGVENKARLVTSAYVGVNNKAKIWHRDAGKYICFTTNDGTNFTLSVSSPQWNGTIESSLNNGKAWASWDGSAITTNRIYLRGIGNTRICNAGSGSFSITGSDVYCYGDLAYLLDYTNPPSSISTSDCFSGMFKDCTALISAPELSFTTLAQSCYSNMFYGTSITEAPELPATNLATSCYYGMFAHCPYLIKVPKLSAITLAEMCYYGMFASCDSLKVVQDELPATEAAVRCYSWMYSYCPSLLKSPKIALTTTATNCCQNMFTNSASLISIPTLLPTTMSEKCYYQMFQGCNSLKISNTDSGTYSIPYRLPAGEETGTIAANAFTGMFLDTGGAFTGTPSIDTTYYLDESCPPVVFDQGYLEFTSTTNDRIILGINPNATIKWNKMEYSIDDNIGNWSEWDGASTIEAGSSIRLRGLGNTAIATSASDVNKAGVFSFTISNVDQGIKCNGNIEALLDYKKVLLNKIPSDDINDWNFENFFYKQPIVSAPKLPAKKILSLGYANMFFGCTKLIEAPDLPAIYVGQCGYDSMFQNCTALKKAPASIYLWDDGALAAFEYMFKNCASLKVAPKIRLTSGDFHDYTFFSTFANCTKLLDCEIEIYDLNAEFPNRMFDSCFESCTSLKEVLFLPLGFYSFSFSTGIGPFASLFENCINLKKIEPIRSSSSTVAIGNQYYMEMYKGCSSIKLSAEKTKKYKYEFILPSDDGTGTNIYKDMFIGTGGTFTGTPESGSTYYSMYPVWATYYMNSLPYYTSLGNFSYPVLKKIRESEST